MQIAMSFNTVMNYGFCLAVSTETLMTAAYTNYRFFFFFFYLDKKSSDS